MVRWCSGRDVTGGIVMGEVFWKTLKRSTREAVVLYFQPIVVLFRWVRRQWTS